MKVTVTIEDEIADISGLVGSLAGYFGNMKPSPWANVPPHVSTPAKAADFPSTTCTGEVNSSPPAGHTWEMKNAKPHHPQRGED